MRFTSVLVTGGAGFVGSHLVQRLLEDGVTIGVLDNFAHGNDTRPMAKRGLHVHRCDIADSELVASNINGYEAVLHQAAIVGASNPLSDPLSMRKTNVDGTLNLLKAAVSENVECFIFASSAAVYGQATRLPLSEENVPNPSSAYGVSKLEGEKSCQHYAAEYGLRTVCLRYFNVYGPGQRPGPYRGVVANFTEKLLRGESPVIYGDGEQTRDFVHVSDVVEANFLALNSNVSPGGVFNVCTGKPTSINKLVGKLCQAMNRKVVEPTRVTARAGDIKYSYGDFGNAQKALGYAPRVGLEQGLRELVAKLPETVAAQS